MWRLDAYMPCSTQGWADHVKADMDERQLHDKAVAALNPGTPREEVSHSTVVQTDDGWDAHIRLVFEGTEDGLALARGAHDWLVELFPHMRIPDSNRDTPAQSRVHRCRHEENESCTEIDRHTVADY